MKTWKDTTTYSQSDKIKIPTTFEAKNGNMSVIITCGHIDYKPDWIMRCSDIGMSEIELHAENLQQAKDKAIELIQSRLIALTRNIGIIKKGTENE